MSAKARAFVIGWPIGHSRSPMIHGHWIDTHGIDGTYEAVGVTAEDAVEFFVSLRAGGWAGGNVTIPHKRTALSAADERDAAADAIGAANTLVIEKGRILARNTDAAGFIANLDAQAPSWRQGRDKAVVLGAGGAARAIVWALRQEGFGEVVIANRTKSHAEALAAEFGAPVRAVPWESRNQMLAGAGLLVNTTSLGMMGQPRLEIDLSLLPADATVTDIVYAPLVTPLLDAASARGNTVVDGLGMLLHQAVPGFAAWFGVTPEVTPALRALVAADLEAH